MADAIHLGGSKDCTFTMADAVYLGATKVRSAAVADPFRCSGHKERPAQKVNFSVECKSSKTELSE
jgi:hypothetical protein